MVLELFLVSLDYHILTIFDNYTSLAETQPFRWKFVYSEHIIIPQVRAKLHRVSPAKLLFVTQHKHYPKTHKPGKYPLEMIKA